MLYLKDQLQVIPAREYLIVTMSAKDAEDLVDKICLAEQFKFSSKEVKARLNNERTKELENIDSTMRLTLMHIVQQHTLTNNSINQIMENYPNVLEDLKVVELSADRDLIIIKTEK